MGPFRYLVVPDGDAIGQVRRALKEGRYKDSAKTNHGAECGSRKICRGKVPQMEMEVEGG